MNYIKSTRDDGKAVYILADDIAIILEDRVKGTDYLRLILRTNLTVTLRGENPATILSKIAQARGRDSVHTFGEASAESLATLHVVELESEAA